LLLSFEGEIIYSNDDVKKQKEINKIKKQRGKLINFLDIFKPGEEIFFIYDDKKTAKIIDERNVEYNQKNYKLSSLTKEILTKIGKANKSGAYQGAAFWTNKDRVKISDLNKNLN
jgi:hypothetical protein